MEKIILTNKELKICYNFTKNACIGGKSHIRNKEDRQRSLVIDNFIGQVGTLAGSIFILGRVEGTKEYIKCRENQDKNPFVGDGGKDLTGMNIDIKCSYMRRSKDPNTYNFLIRPRERHDNWIYLQTLANKNDNNKIEVYIAGWINDNDITSKPESGGTFKGAYKLPVRNLKRSHIILE
jgi:hypothetical protein